MSDGIRKPVEGSALEGTARGAARPWQQWPVVVIVLLGAVTTAALTVALMQENLEQSKRQFREDVTHLANRIQGRMETYASVLGAGAGLFVASSHVGRDEWRTFVSTVNLQGNYPGIQGVGFSERLTPGLSVVDYQMRVAAARDENFVLRTAKGTTPEHAIVYLEPEDARNRLAIGFDMSSEPVRRAAMADAAATGEMRLSGPVTLVQEQAGGRPQPGVLMYVPVYERGYVAPERVSGAERAARLRGYVYAPFRMHDLVNTVLGERNPEFSFSLTDRPGEAAAAQELFHYGALSSPGGDTMRIAQGISIGGRVWVLEALAAPRYAGGSGFAQEIGVAIGGGLVTILLAWIAVVTVRARDQAVMIAGRMTIELEFSRRRFERMVAGTTDGAWEHDMTSQQSFLSPRFREILGFEAVEVLVAGLWVGERVHPEDRRAAVKAFGAMKSDGDIFDQRLRMRMADDSYRWFRVRGRLFIDGNGAVAAGSMSDINEEQESRFREARLLQVVEMSPDLLMTFDLEGCATYLNTAARRIFGEIASDSLAGFSVSGMFSQSEVDRVFNEGVPTAYMQDHWEGETELITAAGEVMPVSQVIVSHKNEAGQVEFYSTVMRDISERRLSMRALSEAQERLQRALDASRDGIWERDVRTDAFSTSDRLAEILGYAPDEMPRSRKGWRALNHPDDMPVSDASVARLSETSETVVWDTRMLTKAGEYRWMRRRGRMVRDAHGDPLLTTGTLTDIHESKMAEFSLRELQARYQRALDGANDGIWEMDEVTGAFECSARFCELIGWTAAHAPRDRTTMRDLIHPADVKSHFASVAAMQAMSGAHCWDVRLRNGEGGYRWQRFRGIATRAPDGSLLLTSGTISDITDARLAEIELRRHRDNLAQLVEERTAGLEQARLDAESSREAAERANLAKSEFLANMSHELRTPMHAIISFANFGVDKSDRAERDKLLHYFRNIQKSGSRLLSLLNDLLDLSKLEAGKMDMAMAPVNAAALLADAMVEAEAFAQNRNVQLVLEADPGQLGVVWDGPRVLQVIRNLISNAVKFSMADGRVVISAQPVLLPAGRRAGDPQVPGIEIRVCDAGIGIPEEELETVFDKFVQSSKTKTGAGGTGLGLAICREIILAHQGSIRAENNPAPQPGATFVVLMPVSPSAARQSRDAVSNQPQEPVEEVK